MNLSENLGELIERAMAANWDSPAFTEYRGETVRYSDVARKIAKIHMVFEAARLKKGDRVAVVGPNSINWAVVFLATVSYGAVVVPILHEFKSAMIHHVVNHSESRVAFAAENIWETLNEEEMPGLAAVIGLDKMNVLYESRHSSRVAKVRDRIAEQYQREYPNGIRPSQLYYHRGTGEELMEINYTSGTTGFSKGVMLPYRSLLSNLETGIKSIVLQPGDTMIPILPMAHALGQTFEFLYPFLSGAHLYILGRIPAPKILLQAFKEVRPKVIILVPLIVEKIYKQRVAKLLRKPMVRMAMNLPLVASNIKKRFNKALFEVFGGNFVDVLIGGAPLNPEVERFLYRIGFHYSLGYGMTECGPIIAYSTWDNRSLYSCGKPVVNVEVRIDRPNSEGVGEIQAKGANVMLGYYKSPELTAEVMTKDGWLKTGDLGKIDKKGNVIIRGRAKTMILGPTGQNIYPEEIESPLNTMEFVQESLVMSHKGRLVALVVPDYSAADHGGITTAELVEIMEENRQQLNLELPAYSQVAEIRLHPEEFEKTPKKSIKRYLYTLD